MRTVILCLVIIHCLLLCGCAGTFSESPAEPKPDEIRAVWISYLDLNLHAESRNEASFRAMAKEMTETIREGKMNTVFLQVRPFSDAIYKSAIFPYSAVIAGTEGADPGFDALDLFCEYAKESGISVHAWINPFRVGKASDIEQRSDRNPAKHILCDDNRENDRRVVNVDGTLYYNPANAENRKLILDGIRELLVNYPIDGIHIDDYFYPTTKAFIDEAEYETYRSEGGTSSLDDWRRTQISMLVSSMYSCVKSFGSDKVFSVSPALQIENNYEKLYADVKRWASCDGYCDWMIPQVYVGFEHETSPFCETIKRWTSIERSPNVRLLFGLAAYKCGIEDSYAGSGRSEWVDRSDILPRQIEYIRQQESYDGFALYSYSYIFGEKMSDNSELEMKAVISMI